MPPTRGDNLKAASCVRARRSVQKAGGWLIEQRSNSLGLCAIPHSPLECASALYEGRGKSKLHECSRRAIGEGKPFPLGVSARLSLLRKP